MTSPDTPHFTVTDRRGVSRSSSGLVTGGADTEMRRLRAAGYSLPNSPTQARRTAAQVQQKVTAQGEMAADIKSEMSRMRRARMANIRRTGSDVSIALPKVRQPLSSLEDKGIPWNMGDPKEQSSARTWARLFYATHDLVPLLVDIYARFPVTGLELQCFAGDTEVITDQGVRRIEDLAGGVHRILTTGGRWVEAPFKDFGEGEVFRVTVQRNGRQREFLATSTHRWFVEEHHQKRLGRNSAKWSTLTWDKVDDIRDLARQGIRHIDIAAQYGVSQPMISKIVRGQAWTEAQRVADEVRPEPGWSKKELLTTQLRPGQRLVSCYGRNIVWQVNPSPFGIAAGMVFGDGYKMSNPARGSSVTLYGDKDAHLLPYFRGCTQVTYQQDHRKVQGITVTDIPSSFKDKPPLNESTSYLYGWLAGYFAADGTVSRKGECFLDSADKSNIEHAQAICQLLGIKTYDPYIIKATGQEVIFPDGNTFIKEDYYRLRLANESLTESFFCVPKHKERWAAHKDRVSQETWRVISVEKTGRVERVYCPQVPGTEAFTLAGNILTGNCKDSKIEQFYSEMFLNELSYEEFLPEALGREYFISGEVTSLAHFDESLGVWASEEILNPDMVRVTKSLFTEQERVQLAVKDMVESLRNPMGTADESPSARLERTKEYQLLAKQYPEIIRAAEQDDGLDISEALWSRLVNRVSPWDTRGTPFLMRSFRTLMMEESLNAAQDAVADRLYSPLILATLGIPDMGDGEPWIPDVGELGDLREDMQAALAADFKLMVHHFGLQIQPVFGRESVPRFDQDYDRIDAKLMQAWGIGQALIMGGTAAAGTYASSALNREVCELLMKGFQKKVIKHMRKRMEVIAEAQEHYDYELKGGIRRPIYREVVEEDPETGEQRIIRRPKLLIPEVNFASLNLRDESTERQFISQLKQMGVPISDKTLAVNLPANFDEEIQRQTEEMVKKQVAEAESMAKVQRLCDEKNLPYPAWLVNSLNQTLVLRQSKAQTDLIEGQAEMQDQQITQMSPAGQMGLLNPPPPPQEEEGGGEQPSPAEPPRNRARPEVSDDMRAGAPRAAKKMGSAEIRPLSVFERGPSSYGSLSRADEKRVEAAVRRREVMARHTDPTISDLVRDPEFFQMLNMGAYQGQIEADWPEIAAGNGKKVPESLRLLQEMVEQYTDATGVAPEWR